MPLPRSAVFALLLVLAAGAPVLRAAESPGALESRAITPAPSGAGSRRQFVRFARTPDGRDTVHALGAGTSLRFIDDGRGGHRTTVVDPDAVGRWIVSLDEPAAGGTFADQVRARSERTGRFRGEFARRMSRAPVPGSAPRILRTFDRLIAAVVVEGTEAMAAELRALPGVRRVARSPAVRAHLAGSVPQVRGDVVRNTYGVRGNGVRVGIIDTGIDYTHPALGQGFGPGHRVAGGWDFVNEDPDPIDDHGHGTHVAGIVGGNGGGVVGMAPDVTFHAYKVLRANGGGDMDAVIAALERCADPDGDAATADQLDVVNLSLGAGTYDDEDAATEAVDRLVALGTTVVISAGNDYHHFTVGSPGIARGAITVGSVDANDAISNFSSRGPTHLLRIKPDLVAPGGAIISAALGGGTIQRSGTSMAAPHVAGAAALLRELRPDWTQEELRSALVAGAVDLGRISSVQGAGRLDAMSAATSGLFVHPTSLAFGRPTRGGDWARSETLHVHTRSDQDVVVDLAIRGALPANVTASIVPTRLVVPAGSEGFAVVTLRTPAPPLGLPEPMFIAEAVIELRSGPEVRRVPFSMHDFLRLDLQVHGGGAVGLVFRGDRTVMAQPPWSPRFMVQPGTYDAISHTHHSDSQEPYYGIVGVPVVRDTVLAMENGPAPAVVRFQLRDERGREFTAPLLKHRLVHESGGRIGVFYGRPGAVMRLPPLSPAFRFEWATGALDTDVVYDIPGTLTGPFQPQVITNDPAQLRRLVEHVAVATADSVLLMDITLMPYEADSWESAATYDPFATPFGASFDIVRWTAPTPYRRHTRFGHGLRTFHPARARAGEIVYTGIGAMWQQDLGDSLAILPSFYSGFIRPGFRGRDLPFGTGPSSFQAAVELTSNGLRVWPFESFKSRWFRDAAGTSSAGRPVEYEIVRNGAVVASGSPEGEEQIFAPPWSWEKSVPGSGPLDLTVRSRGWNVAGRASVTTVLARFDGDQGMVACQGPERFAVVADGGPAERIAFGQHRDPHVEMTLHVNHGELPVWIEYRTRADGPWTALPVERRGREVRAALVPVVGEVSLRVRFAGDGNYRAPMSMEIVPAFIGEPSAAANARLVQARADAAGAHLEWRVGVPGASILVERRDPASGWREYGELVVGEDGSARFDDPAVVAGGAYGYRLGGSTAEVFVTIPAAQAGLAFAISPNPSVGEVRASVVVDGGDPVTLSLLDLQGRVVAARTFTGLTPGLHVLPLSARDRLPAGLYFARLKRGADIRTTRVTLLE